MGTFGSGSWSSMGGEFREWECDPTYQTELVSFDSDDAPAGIIGGIFSGIGSFLELLAGDDDD